MRCEEVPDFDDLEYAIRSLSELGDPSLVLIKVEKGGMGVPRVASGQSR